MGETFHLRDPSSPSALNPTATTRVPAPASGWSEHPRKVQHHLILSLHLSELGGCQPEQPLHCFSPEEQAGMAVMPRSSLHQPTNARAGRQGEMRVAFVAHTATHVLPLQRHLPSFGKTRTGKPHWAGFSGLLHIPLLPNISSPAW